MPSPASVRLSSLRGAQHTLYLPTVVRAQAAMLCPWLDPQDHQAQAVLERIGAAHTAVAGGVRGKVVLKH